MISTRSIAIEIAERADEDMEDAASWLVLERGAEMQGRGSTAGDAKWIFALDGHTGTGPDRAAAVT